MGPFSSQFTFPFCGGPPLVKGGLRRFDMLSAQGPGHLWSLSSAKRAAGFISPQYTQIITNPRLNSIIFSLAGKNLLFFLPGREKLHKSSQNEQFLKDMV
jgi:hypothetical protein